ncbi:MAG: FABP family protein [SAR324 cluster bacterium]|nr:FABP family protein [SAR324 cluster bacterium]
MTKKTDINYGPLSGLIGKWTGNNGLDIAPEPDGSEENPFYETIVFEAAGNAKNAETQILAVVRYHQVVSRKKDDEIFHDETGYWMWDAQEKVVMHSLVIPRGVCLLAGSKYIPENDPSGVVSLNVTAKLGDSDWGILQSPFMRDNARTIEFQHNITISGNKLSYSETTTLEIYGKIFEHTDKNELTLHA